VLKKSVSRANCTIAPCTYTLCIMYIRYIRVVGCLFLFLFSRGLITITISHLLLYACVYIYINPHPCATRPHTRIRIVFISANLSLVMRHLVRHSLYTRKLQDQQPDQSSKLKENKRHVFFIDRAESIIVLYLLCETIFIIRIIIIIIIKLK